MGSSESSPDDFEAALQVSLGDAKGSVIVWGGAMRLATEDYCFFELGAGAFLLDGLSAPEILRRETEIEHPPLVVAICRQHGVGLALVQRIHRALH